MNVTNLFKMIQYETHEVSSHVPTPEGAQILKDGSHEARVWSALPLKGRGSPVTPAQLKSQVGDETAKVGQGRAFKSGWIGKEGDGLVKLVCIISSYLSPNKIQCFHSHTVDRDSGYYPDRFTGNL